MVMLECLLFYGQHELFHVLFKRNTNIARSDILSHTHTHTHTHTQKPHQNNNKGEKNKQKTNTGILV